ncbi:L-fucose:H+ symporter permease [Uliginosibacterium sp. H3]|uniref:L-fucose:H+ symporter permease n=1 Tax=Uliginosibacterium silvisoli TaxID=3114758 RepID=A0ABU6K6E8_9RHOO|nr:L-fucose:H+ symporter permease [Uliginosibacterium sp. H3]
MTQQAPQGNAQSYRSALIALTVLFFMWGLITSLNDILIPHLKALFTLSYLQAMLVQFCFFMAYFVMSFPAGFVVEKIGYKGGILVGLLVAAAGCLMFYPAAGMQSYPLFLCALFVMASGIAVLQVAANPFVTALGSPETASSRLNLTQAFNSLGTTVGPALGATFILAVAVKSASELQALSPQDLAAYNQAQVSAVQHPYLILAGVLVAIAIFIALYRLPRVGSDASDEAHDALPVRRSIWQYPHLVLGALGIFAYVGAEVSIGSLLVSVMGLPEVAGLAPDVAGHYLSIYWGCAMVGRFIGSALMQKIAPHRLLIFNALVNIVLLALAVLIQGKLAMWAMLSIGLFNSIMFPTIFSLALARLGKFTGEGSGVLCMAIVGGAIVPVLQGLGADHIGLMPSFFIPAVCFLYIAWYGFAGSRPR